MTLTRKGEQEFGQMEWELESRAGFGDEGLPEWGGRMWEGVSGAVRQAHLHADDLLLGLRHSNVCHERLWSYFGNPSQIILILLAFSTICSLAPHSLFHVVLGIQSLLLCNASPVKQILTQMRRHNINSAKQTHYVGFKEVCPSVPHSSADQDLSSWGFGWPRHFRAAFEYTRAWWHRLFEEMLPGMSNKRPLWLKCPWSTSVWVTFNDPLHHDGKHLLCWTM